MVAGRFGWKGILVAIVVIGAMMYGGDMCSSSAPEPASRRATATRGAPVTDEGAQFVGFVLDDAQATWRRELDGYQPSKLVLFREAVASACGTATSAVGPFYCPIDKKVYIDLAFYDQLRDRFGAPGDFAQAYVIAHELGHHIQNLRGLLGRGEVSSVATELQADCLAGAWAKDAAARELLEVGDVDEALNAAAMIGDDTIQRKTQGRVQPETFTHGSAKQRSAAFKKGYTAGVAGCDL